MDKIIYKNLPPTIYADKLIPCNFGSIKHLNGSKLADKLDSYLDEEAQKKFVQAKRNKNDIVIITEKIDGMNAGVIKKDGYLYPINRKGYDTRLMGKIRTELSLFGNGWAKWVDEHYDLYDSLLKEGERLVFEYAEYRHTLEYKFHCEPVFLLAKYDSKNKKINYASLTALASKNGIMQPPLLNMGVALPPQIILSQYPKGLIGVKGKIEGIVYSYEHNGVHEACAKYVSNPIMGTFNPIEMEIKKNVVVM